MTQRILIRVYGEGRRNSKNFTVYSSQSPQNIVEMLQNVLRNMDGFKDRTDFEKAREL